MLTSTPKTIFLKDYTAPAFLVSTLDLDVDLQDDYAVVSAKLTITRNAAAEDAMAALKLDGDELELLEVLLDGHSLGPRDFTLSNECLEIPDVPDRFTLTTRI